MTKKCPVCNKGIMKGGHYSSKVRATKFNPTGNKQRHPNLQWARLSNGKRIKICTSCLKKGLHLKWK